MTVRARVSLRLIWFIWPPCRVNLMVNYAVLNQHSTKLLTCDHLSDKDIFVLNDSSLTFSLY